MTSKSFKTIVVICNCHQHFHYVLEEGERVYFNLSQNLLTPTLQSCPSMSLVSHCHMFHPLRLSASLLLLLLIHSLSSPSLPSPSSCSSSSLSSSPCSSFCSETRLSNKNIQVSSFVPVPSQRWLTVCVNSCQCLFCQISTLLFISSFVWFGLCHALKEREVNIMEVQPFTQSVLFIYIYDTKSVKVS